MIENLIPAVQEAADEDEATLYDYVDCDALERLLERPGCEVSFDVDGSTVSVTSDGSVAID